MTKAYSLFLSVAVFMPASRLPAQVAATNLPPLPPTPQYQVVSPAVTLHGLSPVVYFRGLLGMTPVERERALAHKSVDYKKSVLEKIEEYQALPRDIREARLRQTQLRWELTTLMRMAPGERAPRLKEAGPEERAVLAERLRQWDQTPDYLQKAFLANAGFLDFYLRWQASSATEQEDILHKLPAERRRAWSEELGRWERLPEGRRQELSGQFRQFFDLSGEQQRMTLTAFSGAERQAMEKTLRIFAKLPATQRAVCITSFQKFATMGPEERNRFLSNAAQWEAMTAGERKLWRELVQRFPVMPPMPPGFHGNNAQLPPMPPGMQIAPPPPPGMRQAMGR